MWQHAWWRAYGAVGYDGELEYKRWASGGVEGAEKWKAEEAETWQAEGAER